MVYSQAFLQRFKFLITFVKSLLKNKTKLKYRYHNSTDGTGTKKVPLYRYCGTLVPRYCSPMQKDIISTKVLLHSNWVWSRLQKRPPCKILQFKCCVQTKCRSQKSVCSWNNTLCISSQRVCDDVAVLALSRINTSLANYVRFPTNQNRLCLRMTHGCAIGRISFCGSKKTMNMID